MLVMSQSIKVKTLEAAFNQSLSPIVITDADLENDGPHIILCNEAFNRMTGYEEAELIGHNPRMLQGPKTDRSVITRLKHCLNAGEFFHGSTINYRKDGAAYVVEWNISAIYGVDGKICNYVSVQLNLSAQVKAEKERDILANALLETKDCVMVTDEIGRIIFINEGFSRLTGYSGEEVLDQLPFFLVPEENPQASAIGTPSGGVPQIAEPINNYVTSVVSG